MVSQFVSPDDVQLLHQIDFDFPEGTHAIGRLDKNSEGLLLLTTNKKVTKLLFESKIPHKRTYLVQVLHQVKEESLQKIRNGIPIHIKGNQYWTTTPCEVEIVDKPLDLFSKHLEIESFIPHTWLQITLTEGKFHQVRKMVRAIGHKCKRLIRLSIEDLMLGDLQPNKAKELNEKHFFELLKITDY
jgi:23S rRNA pseudouridine2457 synthase